MSHALLSEVSPCKVHDIVSVIVLLVLVSDHCVNAIRTCKCVGSRPLVVNVDVPDLVCSATITLTLAQFDREVCVQISMPLTLRSYT